MNESEIKTESDLQQAIQIAGPKYGCQLMRNNSGAFKDAEGRFVFFGLGNVSKKHGEKIKSSDLIGFRRIELPPTCPGRVALFVAIEVKEPGWKYTGTPREKAQAAFMDWVRMNGGLAGFAQSLEDFKKIIGVE